MTNPSSKQAEPALDELCPWCKKPPEVHDKNNLGIRYLGCPTRGCTGRELHFIIDHLWNTRVSVDSLAPMVAETGTLTVKTAKEIADKALLEALRKIRADEDDFWTFYKADPLMIKAADRIEELITWHGTEQSMHAAWRKRAEEAEAQLTAAATAPLAAPTCSWTYDPDGYWQTACGDHFCITEGTPAENRMRYCHYCGRQITTPVDHDKDGQ